MKLSSLAFNDPLRRHFGAALTLVALFAVCAAANAQQVAVTVRAGTTVPPSPPFCSPPQGGNLICVDKDPVTTPGSVGANVQIDWNIGSPGWSFVKNKGIDIKNSSTWKIKEDSPTQYTSTNKKEGKNYKYEINLTNGTTSLSWDPTIMN